MGGFNDYEEAIQKALDHGAYEQACLAIKKAYAAGEWDVLQKWRLLYYYVTTKIRYQANRISYHLADSLLLQLRNEVCNLSDEEKEEIRYKYVNVLYHILDWHGAFPEKFPDYETIAIELWELVERLEIGMMDGVDLYAFANLSLGAVYGRKGQMELKEAQLLNVRNRLNQNTVISRPAFSAMLDLETTYQYVGKKAEAEQLTLFLFRQALDKKIEGRTWQDMRAVMSRMVKLQSLDGAEVLPLKLLEEFLCSTPLWELNAYADDVWEMCIYYLIQADRRKLEVSSETLRKIAIIMNKFKQEMLGLGATRMRLCIHAQGSYFLAKAWGRDAVHYLDASIYFLLQEKVSKQNCEDYLSALSLTVYAYKSEHLLEQAGMCAGYMMDKLDQFYSIAESDSDKRKMERYLKYKETASNL